MINFTKSEKRELRELANEAYEVELAKELSKLEESFKLWRKEDLSVFELDEMIHAYYSGPRKQLYGYYQAQSQPETIVARALAHGLVNAHQVSTDLKNKIEHLIKFFK